MIITVLIIPLSLPVIFITLFYSASSSKWFMEYSHLSAVSHWNGITAGACLTLFVAMLVMNLLAMFITALFAAFVNRKLVPKLSPSFRGG